MNQPMTPSSSANPYRAPRSESITSADEDIPQEAKLFSTSGRIGRARYILYSIGVTFAIMAAGVLLSLVTAGLAIFPAYIALLVITVMLTIQRCHDFNASGWLALLLLIPLVNLIFWFIPGTDGSNRWGNKTVPNSTGVLVGAWICALIIPLSGILAAISIPAYQQYVERAKAAQAK
jgi:uncharacterized membrane protein YhaH (DUF805 family)